MNVMTFSALAEPNRLDIVELLRDGPLPVGEIAERLELKQPQTSKHLRFLSDAGLVEVQPLANKRIYKLRPQSLKEMDSNGIRITCHLGTSLGYSPLCVPCARSSTTTSRSLATRRNVNAAVPEFVAITALEKCNADGSLMHRRSIAASHHPVRRRRMNSVRRCR